jgi:predicted regulator of Ras-like GTPase activity (Roadblock/LC7/MglB family)
MRFPEDIRYSKNIKEDKSSRLKKVISELKEGADIEGAALVDYEDSVIAYDLPNDKNFKDEIQGILEFINKTYDPQTNLENDSIFAHKVFEYNGFKVLAKKLKDKLTLLVMLRKRGYVSLAMLDVENSIRMIDDILEGYLPKNTYT